MSEYPQYELFQKLISESSTILASEDTRVSNETQRVLKDGEREKDYQSLKKIMIDENNAANLQNQINTISNENSNIKGVSTTKKKYTTTVDGVEMSTTYWLTFIPYYDEKGNVNKINVGCSKHYEDNPMSHPDDGYGLDYENNPKLERARDFAKRKQAQVVINGGIWGNQGTIGDVIIDGIIRNSSTTGYYTLGLTSDDSFRFYPPTTRAEEMLSQGCVNAISGFVPLIMNGNLVGDGILNIYEGGKLQNPRQAIGQMANKDIYIISTDGRRENQAGLTMKDLASIFSSLGVRNAYNLDGGGSVSTVVDGVYINRPIDSNGFIERKCCNFIYWKKEVSTGQSEANISTNFAIGDIKKMVDDAVNEIFWKTDFMNGWVRLKGESGYEFQGIESWDGNNRNTKLLLHKDYIRYWDYNKGRALFDVQDRLIAKNGELEIGKGILADIFGNAALTTDDINTLSKTSLVWISSATPNSPGSISYALLHIQNGSVSALQIAFPYSESATIKQRIRKSDGTWSGWR